MKQTEKYGLNLFEGSDRLRVGPVNENTERLEGAVGKVEADLRASRRIGDLLNTVRKDLDDTWLLCNGEAVPADYPELNRVLYDTTATNLSAHALDAAGGKFGIQDAVLAGEYIVAVGGATSTYSSTFPCVMVGKDLDGAWHAFALEGAGVLRSVRYENGLLVAVGEGQTIEGGEACGLIYTATDPMGPWIRQEYELVRFQDVAYHSGVWGAVGWHSGQLPSVYTAEDPTGLWTGCSLGATTNVELYGITCHEGTWAVCGKAGKVFYTTDISGPWTELAVKGLHVTNGTEVVYAHNKVYCFGGTWVLCGGGLLTANELTGAWTTGLGTTTTSDAITGTGYSTTLDIHRVDCIDGRFYAYGAQMPADNKSTYLGYADSLSGTWEKVTGGLSINSGDWTKLLHHNGRFGLFGVTSNTVQLYTNSDVVLGETWKLKYKAGETLALVDGAMAKGDGLWVIAGYSSIAISAPSVLVAEDPAGPWMRTYPANSLGSTANKIAIRGVAQHNGTWVVVGNTGAVSGTSAMPAICYTDNPTGEWRFKQISDTAYTLTDVACYEGTWVAVGYSGSGNYPHVFVSTNPGEDWAVYKLSTTACKLEAVYCHDGVWVAVGGSGVGKCYSYTAEDPAGTWTQVNIATPYYLHDVICEDGKWVTVGSIGSAAQSALYVSEDPASGWEQVTLSFFSTSSPALYSVGYFAGKWFVAGHTGAAAFIYSTTDLSGEWLQGAVDTADTKVFDLVADDYVVHGLGSAYAWSSYQVLPTVSLDGAYTYIRGKE